MNDPLAGLNEAQRCAVATAPERPLLVVAGAGTGKTHTLTARVAWLVDQGVAPERILLLTFTRRAAREMLGRVAVLVGPRQPLRILGGTFHSVAYRLIRRHGSALGLGDHASVIDPSDVADLVDLVRESLGLPVSGRRVARKGTLAEIYSRTINQQRPLADVLAAHYPWCLEAAVEIAQLCRELTRRKREAQLLDYDDLLLYWQAAMREPQLAATIARGFDHVLVDEYQDVNSLQVDIVSALHTAGVGVSVVGDDMQAIYGFRAASREHILGFAERFPGARLVTLERNYRSSQPILDLANVVAAEAAQSLRRRLVSDAAAAALPELVVAHDEADEARQVVERVLDHYERGTQLREQAVLMRAGQHSALLELELGRRNIPFVKYGGIRYLEAAHIKDFLALVRAGLHVGDEVSWFRVLQLFEGVGPAGARALWSLLSEPLAASLPLLDERLPAETLPAWVAFRERLAEALAQPEAAGGARLLGQALLPLLEVNYPDSAARVEDVQALVEMASRSSDLRTFVDELVLDQPQGASDVGRPRLEEDYLTLSTVHSAKGLEWSVVHLLRTTDGSIPSDMALASAEGVEEERRLFYVAVTRPRRHLHLYAPRRFHYRPAGDGHGFAKLSRFLSPRAQELVVRREPAILGEERAAAAGVAIVPELDHLWG